MGQQEEENPALGEDRANLDGWAGVLWQDF